MPGPRTRNFVAAALGAISVAARAVDVEPEAFLFRLAPGKKAVDRLFIRNDTAEPTVARIEVEGDDAGWLKASRRPVRLGSGQRKTVFLKARAGKMGQGERTAVVVVTVPGPEGSEIRVLRRASLVVAGFERPRVEVRSVVARRTDRDARVRAEVHNAGNVTLRVKVVTELYFTNGRRRSTPPTELVPLAPGATAAVEMATPLTEGPWNGFGRVRVFFLDGQGRTLAHDQEIGPEVLEQ